MTRPGTAEARCQNASPTPDRRPSVPTLSTSRRRRNSLLRRSFVLSSDDLGRRVASGAGFKFLGIGLRTFLTIGSTAVLARLLTPADFGYMAMASVVTEFAGLFASFGFTNILIQRRRISRLQVDTVFWASLGLGALLTAVVFIASFAAGWLFADPRVGPVLRWLSFNFLLGAATSVSWVVMSRLLRFQAEFWIQIISATVRAAVAIGAGWAGLGVYSLVAGGLAGLAAQAIAGFIYVPYCPRLRFHKPFITSTWRTSGSYFGSGVLYYVYTNLDLFVIGRQLGATGLGYYQNARSLTDEIRARIAMPIQHVLFPAFSAVQTDPQRARDMVMRATRLLAAVVVPIGFGVSANARELVLILYGPQWAPMIPVLVMLGLSAALRASTAVAGPLFNAADKVTLSLRYTVVGTAIFLVLLVAAAPFGLEAVAAATAVSTLYSLVSCHAGFRLIGLGWRAIGQTMAPPFVAAAVMWLATELARTATQAAWPLGLTLLAHVALGAVVYLAVLHLLSRQYWHDVRAAAANLRRR